MGIAPKNLFKSFLFTFHMVLHFIGLGLFDEKDVSLKGLDVIKNCDMLYLDNYTSKLSVSVNKLEGLYGKKIILADRELVENKAEHTILAHAKDKDVVFAVVGDIFSATTHVDLWMRARELNIETRFVHSASVFSAVSITGLQLYKFGRTTSIPFPMQNYEPHTPYDVVEENSKRGLHTLLLLDLDPKHNKYMSIKQAVKYLISVEEKVQKGVFTDDTLVVGCAQLGSEAPIIKVGKAKKIKEQNFEKFLQCLIVPGKLHFAEENALRFWEQV